MQIEIYILFILESQVGQLHTDSWSDFLSVIGYKECLPTEGDQSQIDKAVAANEIANSNAQKNEYKLSDVKVSVIFFFINI